MADSSRGARIVEADIARQMATSRSPIREAVRKLEHEGLVKYVPRELNARCRWRRTTAAIRSTGSPALITGNAELYQSDINASLGLIGIATT